MLESHLITALHRLARPARLLLLLCLPHGKQRRLIVVTQCLHGYDLLTSSTAVVRIDGREEHFTRWVLQAYA